MPWCALSGLDDAGDGKLVGVRDSAFAPTKIFEIQTGSGFAALTTPVTLMREGEQATYDGEGIAVDTSDIAPANPGWWIGSEGNAAFGDDDYLPNLLVQVDGDGEVLREVWLPEAIDSPDGGTIRSNGFEGVALSGDGRYALAPIQRQFAGESAAFTRIARVDLTTLDCDGITCTGDWEFFMYPLDAIPAGATWVALSELSHIEDETYAVIERDNVAGGVVKKDLRLYPRRSQRRRHHPEGALGRCPGRLLPLRKGGRYRLGRRRTLGEHG